MSYLNASSPADTDPVANGAAAIRALEASLNIIIAKIFQDNGNFLSGWVTTAQIAAQAITQALIANGAVGTAQIATAAITQALIANGAVGTAQIAAGAITQALIAAGAVGTSQIANNAVGSAQLQNGAVGLPQLGVPIYRAAIALPLGTTAAKSVAINTTFASNTVTSTSAHGIPVATNLATVTGVMFRVTNAGYGSTTGSLTIGQQYFAQVTSTTTLVLHTTRAGALSGSGADVVPLSLAFAANTSVNYCVTGSAFKNNADIVPIMSSANVVVGYRVTFDTALTSLPVVTLNLAPTLSSTAYTFVASGTAPFQGEITPINPGNNSGLMTTGGTTNYVIANPLVVCNISDSQFDIIDTAFASTSPALTTASWGSAPTVTLSGSYAQLSVVII